MAWPPTENELLEAHTKFAPDGTWRGIPMFSPELCAPLVEKGLLERVEIDGLNGNTFGLTEKGRVSVERQRNADTP